MQFLPVRNGAAVWCLSWQPLIIQDCIVYAYSCCYSSNDVKCFPLFFSWTACRVRSFIYSINEEFSEFCKYSANFNTSVIFFSAVFLSLHKVRLIIPLIRLPFRQIVDSGIFGCVPPFTQTATCNLYFYSHCIEFQGIYQRRYSTLKNQKSHEEF